MTLGSKAVLLVEHRPTIEFRSKLLSSRLRFLVTLGQKVAKLSFLYSPLLHVFLTSTTAAAPSVRASRANSRSFIRLCSVGEKTISMLCTSFLERSQKTNKKQPNVRFLPTCPSAVTLAAG